MTFMRIDPRHWMLKSHDLGDIVITHEPIEVTDEQAAVLRQLKRKSLPLVIEVDAPEKPKRRVAADKPASDKEVAPAPKKASTK